MGRLGKKKENRKKLLLVISNLRMPGAVALDPFAFDILIPDGELTSAEFEGWLQFDTRLIAKRAEELHTDNPELKAYGIDLDTFTRGLAVSFYDFMKFVDDNPTWNAYCNMSI